MLAAARAPGDTRATRCGILLLAGQTTPQKCQFRPIANPAALRINSFANPAALRINSFLVSFWSLCKHRRALASLEISLPGTGHTYT